MRSRRSVQIRRLREWLALCAALALIPWTVFLGVTLPQSYTAQHWQVTWVGFDLFLLAFMVTTAVLGFTNHPLLTLFAFATGVLLMCDAWFDVLTAEPGDIVVAVLAAGVGELPLAAVLIAGALRIARLQGGPSGRSWAFALRPRGSRPTAAGRDSRSQPSRRYR
ncbi:hypothetical protein [Mycobacterium sp. E3247]|uniref:hypothetical protein n=1 Tax=Mycobacterium sp. E3247 TaxID=1856864 RepID=UPI0007FD60A0|nr:hypothetical protein [Mycobacterium sp. E3247]OBH07962.1 hypothetical protein A9X04_24015 [Mycobacterium sp. E3247]